MTVATQTLSPLAYLARDRQSKTKSEYLNGQVHPMAGATYRHNLIVAEVIYLFMDKLRRGPCRVLPSDMRVNVGESYAYPDVVIVCEPPEIEDGDILLNPTILVEVLSPSTEGYDRGEKAQKFRTIESLQEYVLISQDSYQIEHYVRQPENKWLLSEATGEAGSIYLPTIDYVLNLADVYDQIDFDEG